MMSSFNLRRLVGLALLVLGTGLSAAESGGATEAKSSVAKEKAKSGATTEAKSAGDSAKEKAKKDSTNLQNLVEQLNAQRDSAIANHEELAKQLKDASEDQKKVILEKMEAQK